MKKGPATGSRSQLSSRTDRLYYADCYATKFQARVLQAGEDARHVILDRTAFYPTSGGQPHDLGRIGACEVVDVVDGDDGIIHVLSSPIAADEVQCEIEWERRFDHMQQHTGQHLLSAVFDKLFGIQTISFHMGGTTATIDLSCASVKPDELRAVEERANRIIHENRKVSIAFEDSVAAEGLRKASERSGLLRIVSIEDLDRSACGGTHVRSTGEIGAILLRSVERLRGNARLEFLCGSRATKRARADYVALESTARVFSAPLDEVPSLVINQAERLKESEKIRQRLSGELADSRGRSLYQETPVGARGIRLHVRIVQEGPLPEDLRSEANGFVSQGRAIFVAASDRSGTAMLAASSDADVHAGELLRAALTDFGGKGGGSAQMAQGSFSGKAESLVARLQDLLSRVV
jgi:alanyl-tRNA synthetase